MKVPSMALLAAFLLVSTAPSHAQTAPTERDECLLTSRNCMDQVDDLQKRVHKLNREIRKGTKTYSPAELKRLKEKLMETNQMLRKLEEAGGS